MEICLRRELAWLSADRIEIGAKIATGYAAAQRGELIGGDEVRARLQELKRAPRDEPPH
jgi:hypothetical protein